MAPKALQLALASMVDNNVAARITAGGFSRWVLRQARSDEPAKFWITRVVSPDAAAHPGASRKSGANWLHPNVEIRTLDLSERSARVP